MFIQVGQILWEKYLVKIILMVNILEKHYMNILLKREVVYLIYLIGGLLIKHILRAVLLLIYSK